jgi:hypothetical protein
MADNESLKPGPFLARWVFANLAGWIFGLFTVALLGVLADLFRFGGELCIGLGMGLCIGFSQWRLARKQLHVSSLWIWSLTVCMTISFLVLDLLPAGFKVKDVLLLPIAGGVGGLLAGMWQSRMLPRQGHARAWFVGASTVGWLLAASLPALLESSGRPNRVFDAVRITSSMLLGGVVIGFVTGPVLMRLQVGASRSVSPNLAGAAD